jgi:murein L,D-transpeptidase YcbB/YkuD
MALVLLAALAALATGGSQISQVQAGMQPTQEAAGEQADPRGAGTPVSPPAAPADPIAQFLRARLKSAAVPPAVRLHGEREKAWGAMRAFYSKRDYLPAWWDRGTLRPAAQRLLDTLDNLAADGLDPSLYPRQELRQLIAAESSVAQPADNLVAMASLETGLTYTFLAAAAHLAIGRVQSAERVRMGEHSAPARVDLVSALERALAPGEDVAGVLAGLAPHAAGYTRLRQALARYRELAARGGWAQVPVGPRLRPGDSGPRVAALAARLAASGELPPGAGAALSGSFDAALAAAVTRFQVTHGLAATSPTVDAATLAALNVPIADRIREIELNLERWRWTTGDLGSRYVLVNIPEFQLSVIEDGNVVLTMNVIVGKVHQQTPVFSDLMTQIVLNPSWHIPDSIASAEVAPALLRDPGYLRRKGYEIRRSNGAAGAEFAANELGEAEINQLGKHGSPFRLVQPPGADNALGRYKFVFPNQFDVYLHDTPSGRLFARSERDFSHGCIRLEKPAELATYLLDGDPQWPPEAVEEAVDSGRTVTIPLRRPLPVHLLYQTTWVDPDGTLQFRPDVYRHDSWLDAALTGESPLWDDLAALRR